MTYTHPYNSTCWLLTKSSSADTRVAYTCTNQYVLSWVKGRSHDQKVTITLTLSLVSATHAPCDVKSHLLWYIWFLPQYLSTLKKLTLSKWEAKRKSFSLRSFVSSSIPSSSLIFIPSEPPLPWHPSSAEGESRNRLQDSLNFYKQTMHSNCSKEGWLIPY